MSTPLDLNPFDLYSAWLTDPGESEHLRSTFAALTAKRLLRTPALVEHEHLLSRILEPLPPDATAFDGTLTAARIAELLGDDAEARSMAVTLVELEILLPTIATRRGGRRRPKAEDADGKRKKFERIRQMVNEDQARVARSSRCQYDR